MNVVMMLWLFDSLLSLYVAFGLELKFCGTI